MSGKTVWIINQYSGSPFHGMEMRHYYLARELKRTGCKVNIISGSYSHLYSHQPSVKDEFTFEEIDGINYCWIRVPTYERSTSIGRIMNMLSFARKLKKLPIDKISRPDAIIVSSPSLFPVKSARKWADRFNAKMIFEVRDIWPLTLQELGGLSDLNPLVMYMKHFERYAYQKADAVVSLLPAAKEHMVKNGMSPSKFINIPNGIYLEEMNNLLPLTEEVNKKIPNDKFIIGYAGTIGIANALEYFVEAARVMKERNDIHFVLAGNGGEKQRLKELSSGLSNITFIDAIDKRMVQSLLLRFDACYIGWRREKLYRFGISANKLFDYMYSGKPVLHSVEAANDPVKEAGCGISVVPEDVEKISKAIIGLQKMSSDERNKMGQRGKEFVLQNHTYTVFAQKFLKLF